MKITIVYGTTLKDTAYNYASLLLNKLKSKTNTHIQEFFLPKDLSTPCYECFSCFVDTNCICPHFQEILCIIKAVEASDLIILVAPNFSYKSNMQMKKLLRNLSYHWLPHRINPSMFNKIGLVISTPSIVNLIGNNTIMKHNLKFWGIQNIFEICNYTSFINSKYENLQKVYNEISNVSDKILSLLNISFKVNSPSVARVIPSSTKTIPEKAKLDIIDFNTWKSNNYINNQKHNRRSYIKKDKLFQN